MRTGRSLTIRWSLLPGGVWSWGVWSGGVSGPGGCLVWGSAAGECLLLGGVSGLGVSGPGGWLLLGGGGSGLGGQGISQHALRQTPPTPPPVDRQMPVKILPWPNFVAAGKNDKKRADQWGSMWATTGDFCTKLPWSLLPGPHTTYFWF